MGQMKHYEDDFEKQMLADTASFYSRKASNWILEDTCPTYMLKVSQSFHCCLIYRYVHIYFIVPESLLLLQAEECLKREKDRVSHYLHFSSEEKLLEV